MKSQTRWQKNHKLGAKLAPQTGFPGHLPQKKGLAKQMFLYLETFHNFENIYLVRYFETRF